MRFAETRAPQKRRRDFSLRRFFMRCHIQRFRLSPSFMPPHASRRACFPFIRTFWKAYAIICRSPHLRDYIPAPDYLSLYPAAIRLFLSVRRRCTHTHGRTRVYFVHSLRNCRQNSSENFACNSEGMDIYPCGSAPCVLCPPKAKQITAAPQRCSGRRYIVYQPAIRFI